MFWFRGFRPLALVTSVVLVFPCVMRLSPPCLMCAKVISLCVFDLRKNDVSKNYLFGKNLSVNCHSKQTVGSICCVVSVNVKLSVMCIFRCQNVSIFNVSCSVVSSLECPFLVQVMGQVINVTVRSW